MVTFSKKRIDQIAKIAVRLRIHSLISTTQAGSGHPTTCLSAADLIAALFFGIMKFTPENPRDPNNDEFILSKGHSAPLLWAAYAEAGIIPLDKLKTLRKFKSPLEGHPTPRMPWIKVATGSLGQGLGAALGMALAKKQLIKQKTRYCPKVYCLLGDGELAEGSNWEAANLASHYQVDNLIAIADLNRLGQSQSTMFGHNLNAYQKRFQAFGWQTIVIDGHNLRQIVNALEKASHNKTKKPIIILAKTFKGKGVSFLENKEGWHGKALSQEQLEKALVELGEMPCVNTKKLISKPSQKIKKSASANFNLKINYKKDDLVATRDAFGSALVKLGKKNKDIVVIDGDVNNSTRTEQFFQQSPQRSYQCFIAEQAMASLALGFSSQGFIPVAATFGAFWTRAHDFIRMAQYSQANIKFVGSHAGVSIGQDGPSQMALEDLAMFRSMLNTIILYPADAVSSEACTQLIIKHKGISYLRTTREKTPLVYTNKEVKKFKIGGSITIKKSNQDRATVIAAGITVHQALKAYQQLKKQNINIRVIDAYSIKPLDKSSVLKAAKETGKMIVVEDHYQGGLGDEVASLLVQSNLKSNPKIKLLYVNKLPMSANPEQLLNYEEIDSRAIIRAVKN